MVGSAARQSIPGPAAATTLAGESPATNDPTDPPPRIADMPVSRVTLLLLLLVVGTVLLAVHLELLTIAFHKLGLSRAQAATVLFTAIAGSFVNLPLFRMRGVPPEAVEYPPELALQRELLPPYHGVTVVSVNVGGCLVPLLLSAWLLTHSQPDPIRVLLAIGSVTLVSFLVARPVPMVGIAMPMFVAPAAALLAGAVFGGDERALTAYVAGTTGVLVGADVLRINDIRSVGVARASIGGAGTFDGIFFTGIIAALLA